MFKSRKCCTIILHMFCFCFCNSYCTVVQSKPSYCRQHLLLLCGDGMCSAGGTWVRSARKARDSLGMWFWIWVYFWSFIQIPSFRSRTRYSAESHRRRCTQIINLFLLLIGCFVCCFLRIHVHMCACTHAGICVEAKDWCWILLSCCYCFETTVFHRTSTLLSWLDWLESPRDPPVSTFPMLELQASLAFWHSWWGLNSDPHDLIANTLLIEPYSQFSSYCLFICPFFMYLLYCVSVYTYAFVHVNHSIQVPVEVRGQLV